MSIITLKIPGTNDFPVYQLLYLFLFISIPYMLVYKQRTLTITSYCWGVIFLWGCLLSLHKGFSYHHFQYLAWSLSVLISCHVISALMLFEKRRCWIYRFFITITLLIALTGVYEGLTGNYYHETNATFLYNRTELGFYRPNTIFFNVNDNAIFSTLCLILSFFYPNKLKENRIVRVLSILLFGTNIIMVDSRGAELAAVAFLFIRYVFYKFKKDANLVILLSVLIVLPFFSLIMRLEFFDIGGRNAIWAMSLRSLYSTYFLGVGPGEIAAANIRLNTTADVYAVHNFVLEILCDYGVIGAIALITWLLRLIKSGYEMFKKQIDFNMLPAIVAFLLSTITCSSLVGKGFSLFFFAIIISEMNRKLLNIKAYK